MHPLLTAFAEENVLPEKDCEEVSKHDESQWFGILKNRFHISESSLLTIFGKRLNLPTIKTEDLISDPIYQKKFTPEFQKTHKFIPVYEDQSAFCIAIDNPFNPVIKQLEEQEKKPAKLFLLSSLELNKYLESFSAESKSGNHNLLDRLLREALAKDASDIHLYSEKEGLTVKARINGELRPLTTVAKHEVLQLISHIKLISHCDVSIITLPQDGRFPFKHENNTYDIRVSTLPTSHGEDLSLRVLNHATQSQTLNNCGFTANASELLLNSLNADSGLILVTGPTGSGKSTTLYSVLNHLKTTTNKNMITLEDPIEKEIVGIRQSQINPSAGYTFQKGLKALLRQDPDVIMIGEIRDAETAAIALEAAYTGHLVLASLHTADVKSTLLRLFGFNCDPFLVRYVTRAIISQKLIPKKCTDCLTTPHTTLCQTCYGTKVHGRTVLAECVALNPTTMSSAQTLDPDQLIKSGTYWSFADDLKAKYDTISLQPD